VTDLPDRQAERIKARINAVATTAVLNAHQGGGDRATAAADLLCAFVRVSQAAGADPQTALEVMLPDATAAVAAFWPKETMQ